MILEGHPSERALRDRIRDETIASVFARTVGERADAIALRGESTNGWLELSYTRYGELVARATTALRALGVRPGDRVVLMLRNIPEFHVLDMACTMSGATPVSIYNSSSPERIAYLVEHCGATVAFAEAPFVEQFAAARRNLPGLRILGTVGSEQGDITYEDVCSGDPIDLEGAAAAVRPDDVATVIYTSGTTGPPKGVVLTHGQVRFTCESVRAALGVAPEELAGRRIISYLPMAHVAERMGTHYTAIVDAYEVTTCPDLGLVASYLREVRPNVFIGVPRVWEKLRAGIIATLGAEPERLEKLEEAVAAALPIAAALAWERATPEQEETWRFLDEVAFSPLRQALGLDELDVALSGAAPIPADLLGWFRAIGVPLSEIYGLSETCGPLTWEPRRVKPGSVGVPIPGCEVTLAHDGEVLCRGGNLFSGYLDDPERTAEVLDPDGWLHTGDIATVDDDGYLWIVDRKKELIVTAGGINVSPANLEARLRLVPLVGQACAVGDNRPYVAALIVLDPDQARAFAEREGIPYEDLEDLARHPRVQGVVASGVEEAMAPFSRAESVRRFAIVPGDWLPDSDELTPTMKLKRRAIAEKYRDEIEALYC